MQGFFNLSFIILMVSLGLLMMHNFKDRGIQLKIDDFLCVAAHMKIAIEIIILLHSIGLCLFFLQRSFIDGNLDFNKYFKFYILLQVAIYVVGIVSVFVTNMNPIANASVAGTVMVLSMKMHSYFATNFYLLQIYKAKMADENEKNTKEQKEAQESIKTNKEKELKKKKIVVYN